MTNTISHATTAAREASRRGDGRFGLQHHADPGVVSWPDDMDDRYDLDDSAPGLFHIRVGYDSRGAPSVAVDLGCGEDFRFHAERFFGLTDTRNLTLSSGLTRGDVVDLWMAQAGAPFLEQMVTERYGARIVDGDSGPRATFMWAGTEPGELDDETIRAKARDLTGQYVNESDPATPGSEYPYDGWLAEAVARFGHPYGMSDLPAA